MEELWETLAEGDHGSLGLRWFSWGSGSKVSGEGWCDMDVSGVVSGVCSAPSSWGIGFRISFESATVFALRGERGGWVGGSVWGGWK